MIDSNDSPDRSYEPASDRYRTLGAPASAEVRIQRSRFLAQAEPVDDPDEARLLVTHTAHRYHDCRHVCYAWRIGHGADLKEMRNDGGEPAGTAGEPILAAIRKAEVSDTVVVVARYFGGIKLGTGGLARAYGQAAAEALAATSRRTVRIGRAGQLNFAYSWQKTISRLLQRHGGKVVRQDYAEIVTWCIWLPNSAWSDFTAELSEVSAGELQIKAPADTDRS